MSTRNTVPMPIVYSLQLTVELLACSNDWSAATSGSSKESAEIIAPTSGSPYSGS